MVNILFYRICFIALFCTSDICLMVDSDKVTEIKIFVTFLYLNLVPACED